MQFDIKAELYAALKKRDAHTKAFEDTDRRAVRGGNAGVMLQDGRVIATDSGSCLRTILLRANGIDAVKDLTSYLTFALGLAYESVFEALHHSKIKVQSQVPCTMPTGTDVPWTGTADFILTFPNGHRLLVDTKSVSSARSFQDVFTHRKIKMGYLAQLVSYMEATGINHGLLAPAAFIYVPNQYLTAGTQRNIGRKIEPDITGIGVFLDGNRIMVEGVEAEFDLSDVRRHRSAAAKVVADAAVAPRPHAPDGGYNPCGLCKFRQACDLFDVGDDQSTEAFFELAKQHGSK